MAYCSEIPVWAVVGLGRRLPAATWRFVLDRLDDEDPWEADEEFVPAGTISHVIGPNGYALGTADLEQAECPVVPELIRPVGR